MFIWPPGHGVEAFILAPESIWYCQVRLLFEMSVKIDTREDPIEMKCAFVTNGGPPADLLINQGV